MEMVIDHRFSPEELRQVIARAEALLGESLNDLVQTFKLGRFSRTAPRRHHRLVELLLHLRDAADRPDDGFAESLATVAIVEVSGVIEAMEDWRSEPRVA